MPGTIGTYHNADGREVPALVAHDGAILVLVDNNGFDPFGGRYVEETASNAMDVSAPSDPDQPLALAS